MTLAPTITSHSLLSSYADRVWDGEVVIQERFMGTSIRFGLFDNRLLFGDDGAHEMDLLDAPAFFSPAVHAIHKRKDLFGGGVTYYANYLPTVIGGYHRTPVDALILTDARDSDGWLSVDELCLAADHLGLEVAPLIFYGRQYEPEHLPFTHFKRVSALGNLIAGIDVKNYSNNTFAYLWNPEVTP